MGRSKNIIFPPLIKRSSRSLFFNLSNKIYTLHQPADYSFQRFVKKKLRYTYITYAGNFGQAQDFKTIISAFKSNRVNKNVKLNLIAILSSITLPTTNRLKITKGASTQLFGLSKCLFFIKNINN